MGSSENLNYKAFNYKLLSLKMVRFDNLLLPIVDRCFVFVRFGLKSTVKNAPDVRKMQKVV